MQKSKKQVVQNEKNRNSTKVDENVRRRKIKSAFLKVTIMAMLLIVSTYAWFTSQKDITLSNIRGTVEVVENMEISLDAKTWYQRIDLSDAENIFELAQASRDESLNEISSDTKSTALAILPEQLFPVSGVGKTGVTLLPLYSGEATSTSLSGIAQCLEEEVKNGKDVAVDSGYIAFDIYIKNTSRDNEDDILQLNINSSAQVLTETISKEITDVEGNRVNRTYNGNDASGLQNTIRVALAKYAGEVSSTSTQLEILTSTKGANISDIAIWEPNAYDHVESIVANNNKLINGTDANKIEFTAYHPNDPLETYALNENAVGQTIENVYNIATTGLGEQKTFKTDNIKDTDNKVKSYRIKTTDSKPVNIKNTSEENFIISSNKVTRYRVYVWLEGQDVDCINVASLGGGIELDLGLTKDNEVGEVLTQIDDRIKYNVVDDTTTATITMENQIVVLPDGWEYVDGTNQTQIQKEYTEDTIEQVEITDSTGNKTRIEVIIGNPTTIEGGSGEDDEEDLDTDITAPTLSVSYSTTDTTTSAVTATITANEKIQLPSGWTFVDSNETAVYKEYSKNATESVTVKDVAGNSKTANVSISNIISVFTQTVSTDLVSHMGLYTNYPVDIDGNTSDNDWKILYADGKNVFLIPDLYVPTANIPTATLTSAGISKGTRSGYENYTVTWNDPSSLTYTIDTTSKFMTSDAVNFSSSYDRYKVVASLLETSIWTPVFASDSRAESAIGGPTYQMLKEAWNTIYSDPDNDLQMYYNSINERGYKLGGSIEYIEFYGTEGYYNTLFFPHTNVSTSLDGTSYGKCKGYFLASPGGFATDVERVLVMDVNGPLTEDEYTTSYYGLRPIVCLKADTDATKSEDVWNLSSN